LGGLQLDLGRIITGLQVELLGGSFRNLLLRPFGLFPTGGARLHDDEVLNDDLKLDLLAEIQTFLDLDLIRLDSDALEVLKDRLDLFAYDLVLESSFLFFLKL